jgi:hypothetical protein
MSKDKPIMITESHLLMLISQGVAAGIAMEKGLTPTDKERGYEMTGIGRMKMEHDGEARRISQHIFNAWQDTIPLEDREPKPYKHEPYAFDKGRKS